MKTRLLVGMVGDLVVDRDQPGEAFSEVRHLLRAADIAFGNLESPYSDAPEVALTANIAVIPKLHNLDALRDAGFDILSMANNHVVDAGHAAMLDTRSRLRNCGIETCGAGVNLQDARRAAIVERDGSRVGFLAYASVFPHGYQARSDRPGLAPLRAYNHFFESPEFYAPGEMPRVETIPDPVDHHNLKADIETIRDEVDLVATSFHWGDFRRPFVLTDHEVRTARFSIDCGADVVIGHHHHALRGVEWYKGKPIFYGLGHWVFDCRLKLTDEVKGYLSRADAESYSVFPREGWPLLPLHPDTRMTMWGWVRAEGARVIDAGFVPCRLCPDGRVVIVDCESPEGREVVAYITKCNVSQKLNGRIVSDDAPIIAGHRSVRVEPIN